MNHIGGKNPGDVIDFFNEKGSGGNKDLYESGEHHNNPSGRNPGDLLPITTKPNRWASCSSCLFAGKTEDFPNSKCPKCKAKAIAHFASYPVNLVTHLLKATAPPGATILDPFMGSGTTAEVAGLMGLRWIGIEAFRPYVTITYQRLWEAGLWHQKVDGVWEPPTKLIDNF